MLAGALMLALASAAVAVGANRDQVILSRTDLWVSLLAVVLLASISQSRVPHISARATLWLALFFCAYVVARKLTESGRARALVVGIGAIGTVAGAVALAAAIAANDFATGPFLYRHMFSALVLLCAILLAGGLLSGEESARAPWALFCVTLSACIAGTVVGLNGSRSVILAGTVALAVIFVVSGWRRRGPLWFAGGSSVGLVAANLLSRGFFADQVVSLAQPGQAALPRFVLWASALPLIAERPLSGHGPDLIFAVWQPFRDPQDLSAGYYIHQSFLDFAVGSGIFASILLIVIFRETIVGAWQRARDMRRAAAKSALSAWMMGAGVLLLVHALGDFNLLVPAIWLLFGLVAGLTAAASAPLSGRWQPGLARVLPVTGLLLGVALPVYAAAHIAHVRMHDRAVQALERGEMEAAYALADSLTRSFIPADDGWLLRAHIVATAVLESDSARRNPAAEPAYRSAVSDIQRALAHNALRPATYRTGGRLHLAAAELSFEPDGIALAGDMLRAGVAVDPRDLDTRALLATALQRADMPEQALDVLVDGLRYRQLRDAKYDAYRERTRRLATSLGRRQVLAWLGEHP